MSSSTIVLRLRSRDGLERVSVPSGANVGALKQCISQQLGLILEDQILSTKQELLLSQAPEQLSDLQVDSTPLSKLGLGHGSMLYLRYFAQRSVAGPSRVTPSGAFGRHMTVEDLIARQTRIERQEQPNCASVSFDRDAANAFQSYVHESLAFSVKRGGFMYGTVSDEGEVAVDFIYEPPQQGTEVSLALLRDEDEEKRVELIATGLGMRRVGFVFTRALSTDDPGYTMSNAEIRQVAALQVESGSEHFAAAIVKLEKSEEGAPDVHFEAFQLSDQCVKLYKDEWFVHSPETPPNLSRMKKDVILAGKDTFEVDNDFFLVPVKILPHQGPLRSTFPIENRIPPASEQQLRQQLERSKGRPFSERIADFHMLLFLSLFLDPNTDLLPLAQFVRTKGPVPDGYQLIIEAL